MSYNNTIHTQNRIRTLNHTYKIEVANNVLTRGINVAVQDLVTIGWADGRFKSEVTLNRRATGIVGHHCAGQVAVIDKEECWHRYIDLVVHRFLSTNSSY